MRIGPKLSKPLPSKTAPSKIESKPLAKPSSTSTKPATSSTTTTPSTPKGPSLAEVRQERASKGELPQFRSLSSNMLARKLSDTVDLGAPPSKPPAPGAGTNAASGVAPTTAAADTPPAGPVVRDGTPETALAWAQEQTVAEANTTTYNNKCLTFVSKSLNWGKDGDGNVINPELRKDSAIDSYNAFNDNGKINTGTPIPAGAPVFFEATEHNGNYGHVAVATGEMAADGTPAVISSGWPGHDGVFETSVGELSEQSGAYLGYGEIAGLPAQNAAAPPAGPGGFQPAPKLPPEGWNHAGLTRNDLLPPSDLPVEPGGSPPIGGAAPIGGSAATNPAGGLPQQWQNTCGPNTIMAMEASVDPGRAQALRAANTPEQRAELEASIYGSSPGFQNVRPNTREPGGDAAGWSELEMSRQISNRFEGDAVVVRPNNRTEAVDALTTALEAGSPVAVGLPTHWVSATEIREGEGGREVLFHDSWSGDSAWVPEAQLRDTSQNWMSESFPGSPFAPNMGSLVYPETPQLDPSSTFRANE